MKFFSLAFPIGWPDVFIRSAKVALVVFLVLQLKEFIEIGSFDTPAALLDAMYIAGGTLVLNAILRLAKT